jgi:MFS family permease
VGAAASAASLGYWQYLIFKLPIGFGCGGIGVASFVLSTEPLEAKWRAFLGIATQYWWASGICFMSGVAAIVTEWRTLTFFFVFLTGMYAIFSSPLVKESPRWLLITGEAEKAHAILTAYAKANDKRIPPEGLPPLVSHREPPPV